MTKFTYPDIHATQDRTLYSYLVQLDRVLKDMGRVLNNLEEQLENINKGG